MCNGQASALSNTHSALTATLVANPTNPTLLLVPSVTSTSTSSSSTSSTTQSATPSPPVSSNSTATSNSTSSPSASNAESANPNQKLSTPTIIGIAVASVGGAALIFIAILLCCYKRKKKDKPRESDMIGAYQTEPVDIPSRENTQRYRRMLGPDGTADGMTVRMIPPMPGIMRPERPPRPSSDEALRNAYSAILESSQDTNTIGLAISELGGDVTLERRPTRHSAEGRHFSSHASILGPERASLDEPRNGDHADRRSIATTIEEEPDNASSGGDSWGARSTDRMLSTISVGDGKMLSANGNQTPSFLLKGHDGNHWRAGEESEDGSVKPEFFVKPLRVSKSPGETSKTGRSELDIPRFPAPPILPTLDLQPPENGTLASSYYGDSLPPSGHASHVESTSQPQTRFKPYQSRQSTDSIDTVTTMESTLPPIRGSNILSPINESPSSVRTHRSSVALPFQRLSADVSDTTESKPLKSEEIAAMRAMRLRTQQAQNMQHPLERTETGTSSSQGSFAKRKPADLTIKPDEAEKEKKGQWRVVDSKSRKQELQELEQVPKIGTSGGTGVAQLTPTRKGEVLYLKVHK